jgi:hypothetical protein
MEPEEAPSSERRFERRAAPVQRGNSPLRGDTSKRVRCPRGRPFTWGIARLLFCTTLRLRGRGEGLVADLLLVSEDKASVLQVSPRDARGEAYGGFNYPWRIDEGMETLIAVMNPSESEEVNFSLFLFYGEQSYTYEGGRLRPGEVRWMDLRELRDRRIPDQMGRRLPHRVSAGQAKLVVHGIAGVSESQRIIGEAILVDRRRGIRVTMACPNCVSEPLRVEPGVVSVSGVVGERRSVTARVYYADGSSWVINDGRAIDWLESSVSVVQVVVVSDPVRRVDRFEAELRSPGTARIGAQVNHCWICTPCIDRTLALTPEIQVTVQPKVTVTGPGSVPLRASGTTQGTNSIQLTASGTPSGGTYQWSTTSSKISLSNTTQATVTVTSVSQSTSRNDVPITVRYTVNGQSITWNGTLTVVKPTSLERLADNFNPTGNYCGNTADCPGCNYYSFKRIVNYKIKDQFGGRIEGFALEVSESFQNFSSTCGARPPTPGGSSGRPIQGIADAFTFCSAACMPGGAGCTAQATQTLFVNGFSVRTNSVRWTCTDATITEQ